VEVDEREKDTSIRETRGNVTQCPEDSVPEREPGGLDVSRERSPELMEFYFSVISGNIHRCMAAENPEQACVRAYLQHKKDETTLQPPMPGTIYEVAEFNATEEQHLFILAESVVVE